MAMIECSGLPSLAVMAQITLFLSVLTLVFVTLVFVTLVPATLVPATLVPATLVPATLVHFYNHCSSTLDVHFVLL